MYMEDFLELYSIKTNFLECGGISIIADLIDENCSLMSMEDFQELYTIKTNFLEYGGLMLNFSWIIKKYQPMGQIAPQIEILKECQMYTSVCTFVKIT